MNQEQFLNGPNGQNLNIEEMAISTKIAQKVAVVDIESSKTLQFIQNVDLKCCTHIDRELFFH